MSTLKVDLDLVQKYNAAGPHYTSYPHGTDEIRGTFYERTCGIEAI